MPTTNLTSLQVKHINSIGTFAIGDPKGLVLRVRQGAHGLIKQWAFRYMFEGKAHWMGLGSGDHLSLAQARAKAKVEAELKAAGSDPLAKRVAEKSLAHQKRQRLTFDQCADNYIRTHTPSWKNAKHAQQWTNTVRQYASPVIGSMKVDDVKQDHVMKLLAPIWTAKNETAIRVRGRIESVLDWAKAQGMRQGDNPAAWEGGLRELLPAISRLRRIKHHPALPYTEIGSFMLLSRGQQSMAARALEFLVLTACRTNEVIGATWSEVDLDAAQWIIPVERMKAGREHRVPLSTQAVALLKALGTTDGPVFASPRGGFLSNMAMLALHKRMDRADITPHGFRSTFRDWAGETTNHAREVIEHALAHALKDQSEAAYSRGTLMQKRRQLMQEWADRCDSADVSVAASNVIDMRGVA